LFWILIPLYHHLFSVPLSLLQISSQRLTDRDSLHVPLHLRDYLKVFVPQLQVNMQSKSKAEV
jgi:hypothetical protein